MSERKLTPGTWFYFLVDYTHNKVRHAFACRVGVYESILAKLKVIRQSLSAVPSTSPLHLPIMVAIFKLLT